MRRGTVQAIEIVDRAGRYSAIPIYLETESKELESMCTHLGFHTVEELNVCVPGDERDSYHGPLVQELMDTQVSTRYSLRIHIRSIVKC